MQPVDSATYTLANGRTKMRLYRGGEVVEIEASPDPYCYLPAKYDVETRGHMERTDMRTLDTDENVKKFSFQTPDGVKGFRTSVEGRGMLTYEADKRYIERWMLANGVTCSDYPNYASWDTEEDDSGEPPSAETARKPIIAVGIHYHGQTTTWTGAEPKLLKDVVDFLVENKITLLKGWNSGTHTVKVGWDLPYFTRRLYVNRVKFDLRSIRFVDSSLLYRYLEKNYKAAWSLESVGRRLLHADKPFVNRRISSLPDAELRERVGWDARITDKVDTLKRYTLLATDLAKRAGQFPDSILGVNPVKKLVTVTPTLDNWIIRQANLVGYVMPCKRKYEKPKYEGAWVYLYKKGTYYNVLQFDFDSLYPNTMLAFNIAPYNKYDVWFPIIKTFLEGKKNSKGEERWGYKILVNAMYGIMASSFYRFRCADKALEVTTNARGVTRAVADFLTSLGYIVYKSDTDSIFVQANSIEDRETIQAIINSFVQEHFKVDNINMAFECMWENLNFPRAAAKDENKKKYYGIVAVDKDLKEVNEFHVVGMEFLRNDWCDLAKEVQDKVMHMKSNGAPVGEIERYANDVVDGLLHWKFDDKLTLEKSMSQKPEDYGKEYIDAKGRKRVKPVPPHVRAFRDALVNGWVPSDMVQYNHVRYMMCRGNKPRLVNLVTPDDIDRGWYLQKQIYPILYRLDVIDALPKMKLVEEGQTTLF